MVRVFLPDEGDEVFIAGRPPSAALAGQRNRLELTRRTGRSDGSVGVGVCRLKAIG
jgi:hypothetical protein